MSMGIGINTQKPDAGEIRGRQEDIACGVWFTSGGNPIPQLVKYKEREVVFILLNVKVEWWDEMCIRDRIWTVPER